MCRASFTHLRHFRSIKDTLTRDSLEKVSHAFIGSRLDYCNALLCGLPQSSISKLHHIQNAAAGLLMGTMKLYYFITVLKSVHWLPVEKRIDFKVLLLVHHALHDDAPEYERYAPGEN